MPRNENWTREQTIIALNLYCKIPFNRVSSSHPDIIRIANIIGRNPNAVKMKVGNFGSFDPELKAKGIVGLANASRLDKEIWDEFNTNWELLAYQSESLIAQFSNKPIEEITGIIIDDLPVGRERETMVKVRVNQGFFRSTILSSYNQKCCITGLSVSELLVASHIIPWRDKEHIHQRLNPRNGLCLNTLHDRAFDQGYITITTDYKVKVSKRFDDFKQDNSIGELFLKYDKQEIILPDRFLPDKEFLEYHYDKVFKK